MGASLMREVAVAHTYEELKDRTVAELRDIAKNLNSEGVQGYSQMNKEHLLPALCRALGVDVHEHHDVTGIDKAGVKARIRDLKQKRHDALEAHDYAALHSVRRELHRLNHRLRANMH